MPSKKEGNSSHDHTHHTDRRAKREEGRRGHHDDRPRQSRFRSRSRSRDRRSRWGSRERDRKRRWSRSRSRSRERERGGGNRASKWDQEKLSQPVISNVYSGKVTSIMNFGCFVQLEGNGAVSECEVSGPILPHSTGIGRQGATVKCPCYISSLFHNHMWDSRLPL